VVRIPADRIDHLYRCERPGQTHGYPLLLPVMNRIWQMAEFDSYEMLAAKTSACIALVVTRNEQLNKYAGGGLAADSKEDGIDTRGNTETMIEPQMIFNGKPGEDVKGFMQVRPGNMYKPFMEEQKALTAAGTNLGFEQVARDFSKGTFASQRQSKLEDQRVFMPVQGFVTNHMNRPVWNEFVSLGMLAGAFDNAPMFSDDIDVEACEWIPQAWGWIDPAKEHQGIQGRVELRTMSRTRAAAEQGIVLSDEIKQIAAEEAQMVLLGIDPSLPGSSAPPDGDGATDPGDDDDEKPSNNGKFGGRLAEALK
jgi:lambda family phage portal protein